MLKACKGNFIALDVCNTGDRAIRIGKIDLEQGAKEAASYKLEKVRSENPDMADEFLTQAVSEYVLTPQDKVVYRGNYIRTACYINVK